MNEHTTDRARLARLFAPGNSMLGLTAREADELSPGAFVEAALRNDKAALARIREASELVHQRNGTTPDNLSYLALPGDALMGAQTRDLTKGGGGTAGGFLVGTEQPAFFEQLRSQSFVARLPVQTVDCVGDASIPVATSSAAGWTGEGSQYVDATIVVAAKAATPKYIVGTVVLSQQLLRQMQNGARRLVDATCADAVSQAFETAVIAGAGGTQPAGIILQSGVTSVSGSSLAWSGVAQMETAVLPYARDDLGWIVGASAAQTLRTRMRESGSGSPIFGDTGIGGRLTMASLACPTATAVFGAWQSLLLCSWSPIEFAADPYSSFASGKVSLRFRQAVDVVLRAGAAFAKSEAIT